LIEFIPILAAFSFALVDWVAVAKQKREIEKYFKPLTLITLILWVIGYAIKIQSLGNQTILWLVVGLFFCLVGDILLYLPPKKWFIPGLIAFLLGHVGYIFSFGVFKIEGSRLVPALVLGFALFVAVILVLKRLVEGLKKSGKERMTIPIIIYSLVITFMVFSAAYRLMDFSWATGEAVLLAGGALLFYISDILNAWERFVSKFRNDRLVIMMTYHLGQFGISVGVMFHIDRIVST
jgi:uncharacterized membrane protein YhhN